jgi:hypothetical protein
VVVDGGVRDARPPGNIPYAGAGEALLGKETQGRVEDLLASEGSAPYFTRPFTCRRRPSGRYQWSTSILAQPNLAFA